MSAIVSGEPSVLAEAVMPSLLIPVTLDFVNSRQAILRIEGFLKSEDDKILASVHEFSKDLIMQLGASDTSQDSNRFQNRKYSTTLIAELNERTLQHLEDVRKRNALRNVVLKLTLLVNILESNVVISHLWEIPPQNLPQMRQALDVRTSRGVAPMSLIGYAYDPSYGGPDRTNLWILSANGGPDFMKVQTLKIETSHSVKSSDWIQLLSPKLGLGKHVIVELSMNVDGMPDALEYLRKAEQAYMTWDSKSVFAHCRELGTLLDNKIKQEYGKDSFAYSERWGKAYANFSTWASLDLHIEDIRQKKTQFGDTARVADSDAEAIINFSKALLKLASEMLKNRNK